MCAKYVGQPVLRKDGYEKVTGKARYIDDIHFPDMLHGISVRSSLARAKIREIQFDPSIHWKEWVTVIAKDIPGENQITTIMKDQPCLADQIINHAEEAFALLAHSDKNLLEKGRKNVHLIADPLTPVLSIEDSLDHKEIIWGKDNLIQSYQIEKGNVDPVWEKAGLIVVEGEYRTGAQEHLYIENHGVIAMANPKDGITVWGSLQCPYYVHKALQTIFPQVGEKIRVIQTETGGGFGGKED